jgi:hypothetical protein
VAGVLGWPGGQVLVGIVGVAMIAIAAYQAFDAARVGFADSLKTEEMTDAEFRLFTGLGLTGLIARSPWLLGAVAVGLVTFAAFSLMEARYRRL